MDLVHEFLFPSTGMAFPNKLGAAQRMGRMLKFLFPSTGMAFLNNKRNLRKQDH